MLNRYGLVLERLLYSVSVREQELQATSLTTIHMYVTNTRFSCLDVVDIGKVTSISASFREAVSGSKSEWKPWSGSASSGSGSGFAPKTKFTSCEDWKWSNGGPKWNRGRSVYQLWQNPITFTRKWIRIRSIVKSRIRIKVKEGSGSASWVHDTWLKDVFSQI